jgi:phosphoesterase RecJ-like protein
MDKNKVDLLVEKIRNAENILIFGHKNPDGDSVGASLGLQYLIADNFGKTADVAYDGNYPIKLDFLPGRKDIWYIEKILDKKYDLFIAVDMGSKNQYGDFGFSVMERACTSIRIDHHKTSDCDLSLEFVNTSASSASEIIFDIARSADWTVGTNAAICLCTGIYRDTGNFAYIDDNNKPLLDVAELVNLGANMRDISDGMNIFTRGDMMAEVDVLRNAEFFFDGKLAIATIPNRHYKKLDSGRTEIIWNLRYVKGVECVAILKEARKDDVGLSLRSRRVVIRQIAEKFNGGGHDLRAGGRIHGTLDAAKKMIVKEFEEIFDNR